jgi:hypothetical protein
MWTKYGPIGTFAALCGALIGMDLQLPRGAAGASLAEIFLN